MTSHRPHISEDIAYPNHSSSPSIRRILLWSRYTINNQGSRCRSSYSLISFYDRGLLALIARSRTIREMTARTITACLVLSQSCRPVHHRMILRVLPMPKKPKTTPIVEVTIKILRRPHLNLHRSDIIPTSGCTMTPEHGPAIHTNESVDFGSPRDNRYGLIYANSTDQDICIPAINKVSPTRYIDDR
jgi:hypothetical protein